MARSQSRHLATKFRPKEKSMADDSGPLLSVGQLVPGVYYDLIARVCAGVPFLVLLLWEDRYSLKDLAPNAWVGFLLLMGAGYLAGLLLTPVSVLWNIVIGLPTRLILNTPMNRGKPITRCDRIVELQALWSRNDQI